MSNGTINEDLKSFLLILLPSLKNILLIYYPWDMTLFYVIFKLVEDQGNLMLYEFPLIQELKKTLCLTSLLMACWNIVKDDLYRAVLDFFNGVEFPIAYIAYNIVMIPETPHLRKFSEFRPISLCNLSCKIIPKILTNRLDTLLPKLIYNQNGFVEGRLISDSILLVQELPRHLGDSVHKGNVVLKLDNAKEFDRLH